MRVVGGLVVVTGIIGVIALMRGRPRARDLPVEPANTATQTVTATAFADHADRFVGKCQMK